MIPENYEKENPAPRLIPAFSKKMLLSKYDP